MLGLPPDEYRLVIAALDRAEVITRETDKNRADYLSGRTAGLTAKSITRWLAKALRG